MDTCPCGSNTAYDACCRPLIQGERPAETAEQLMRSRYSAYVKKELEYIFASLHPGHRSDYDARSTRAWAESAQWHGIEIVKTVGGGPDDHEGQVEFVVTYSEDGTAREHHELSTFEKEAGTWYFVSGKTIPPKPVVRPAPKVGRNDPCSCGSGRKYKKCCGA
ncbi:MAG: YchJ family protein [Nitrospirota bacterium]